MDDKSRLIFSLNTPTVNTRINIHVCLLRLYFSSCVCTKLDLKRPAYFKDSICIPLHLDVRLLLLTEAGWTEGGPTGRRAGGPAAGGRESTQHGHFPDRL